MNSTGYEWTKRGESFYTPACGLALQSTEDTEAILSHLMEFRHLLTRELESNA